MVSLIALGSRRLRLLLVALALLAALAMLRTTAWPVDDEEDALDEEDEDEDADEFDFFSATVCGHLALVLVMDGGILWLVSVDAFRFVLL